MNYEFEKYVCTKETLKATIDLYGVAVIPSVLNEDECLKLDNKNKEIYKHNNDLYKSITNKLKKENAMIKIETPPSPPTQPNNYERYIMYKTRNVSKNVRHQSLAVQYLLNNGHEMCLDNKEVSDSIKKFEPYEAIELVEKIENTSIDNLIKKDPKDRMSSDQILEHPFLKNAASRMELKKNF